MRWRKIDQATQEIPSYLDIQNDICYYAREYVAYGGYNTSDTNSVILNFKKPPSVKDTPQWHYRQKAVKQIATELYCFFKQLPLNNIFISWIPSSKLITDPEYNSRFEDLLLKLAGYLQINYGHLIISKGKLQPSHLDGPRDPSILTSNFTLNQDIDISPFTWVVLIDDVITSGSHFKVCKNLILEKFSEKKIAGVFWAKTIHR